MKLSHVLSRVVSNDASNSLESRHIPFIVTPLADKLHEPQHGAPHLVGHASSDSDSEQGDVPVFKHRHESSTIELFYDLFFVANLATFTVNHDINDGSTFRSYLGFFSLLWATWLATSLFDVRFACESIFNRICKGLHFGVMIGFTISGAVFTTENVSSNRNAFQVLAIMMMVSRLTLAIQYAQVLWFVRKYNGTYVPLGSMVAILVISAAVYFGTFFGFTHPKDKTYYAWYVMACIEILVSVVVSSIWRVVSFKRTHLVERIGLLTLIVTGEGILGLSKSVSYLLQSASAISARDVGVLISSVLLIYFIWMLYFDQIQNERFGTIKQQVWALLHYPLHICILFTVEGSTNLFIWNIAAPLYVWWMEQYPVIDSVATFETMYPTQELFLSGIQAEVKTLTKHFKTVKKISKYYDYHQNITSLEAISVEYGSVEYIDEAVNILAEMWLGLGNAIFQVFGVKPPEDKETPSAMVETDSFAKAMAAQDSIFAIFETIFNYFYIAAGLLLIVLAFLYIFGNKNKSKIEWTSIGTRVLMGVAVITPLTAIMYPRDNSIAAASFLVGPWHVIIVMLVYLVVLVLDNLLIEYELRNKRRKGSDVEIIHHTHIPKGSPYQYQRAAHADHVH